MCRDGCIQLGAVDHPVVGERLVAVGGQTYYRRGDGAFGALKVVGQAKRLEACVLATSSVAIMPASAKAAFLDVSSRALHVVYDHDCYAFTLLAKGKVDAVVEFGLKPCDFAGLVPVLASAGCQVLN